jgi:hypothetical protein
MSFPPLPRHLLAERIHFSLEDQALIARCRRSYNRLGLAYQMAFLRLMGRFPRHQPIEVQQDLLAYIAQRLGIDPKDIERYAQRRQTLDAHAEQIRTYLGYHVFAEDERLLLSQFLDGEVEHLESVSALVTRAEDFLRTQQILLPATSTLRRLVMEERAAHRARLFDRMMGSLPRPLREQADALLLIGDDGPSPLAQLKEPPGRASPRSLLSEMAKLTLIEETGLLKIDLSWIRSSLRKAMARRIRYSDAHRVRELKAPRRYTALVCFLHETHAEIVDTIVDMHAKLMTQTYRRAQNRLDETLFMLEYLAQPELRRRVRQGLLKSEQLHALARSVFYGKLGRADWRDFQRQMSTASCLLLVLASIIYWQIKEIERVIGEANQEELEGVRLEMLSHVSPIRWENVLLYGQYVLRRELVKV